MARQKTPIRPRGILAAGRIAYAPVVPLPGISELAVTVAQHNWPDSSAMPVEIEVSEDNGQTWSPGASCVAGKGSGRNPLGGLVAPQTRLVVQRIDVATGLPVPLFNSSNALRRVRVVTNPKEALDTAIDLEQD